MPRAFRTFWPFIPRVGSAGADETRGSWRRVGERVAAHPRRVWVTTTVLLGVDYNIFLMARTRDETLRHGGREGMLRGLAVGGVITSAGIVLAGTFTMLATLPLKTLTELGFTIAFGVLLDTFVARSVLVPALVFDFGPRVWWPSALARRRHAPGPGDAQTAGERVSEVPSRVG